MLLVAFVYYSSNEITEFNFKMTDKIPTKIDSFAKNKSLGKTYWFFYNIKSCA